MHNTSGNVHFKYVHLEISPTDSEVAWTVVCFTLKAFVFLLPKMNWFLETHKG